MYTIKIIPSQKTMTAPAGETLLTFLRSVGLKPDAVCGGHGTCGKCKVWVDGNEQMACQTVIDHDMVVKLKQTEDDTRILSDGCQIHVDLNPVKKGYLLAVDIGTTTIACYLLDEQGRETASASILNPQVPFGADVISRIQAALNGEMEALTEHVRSGLAELTQKVCRQAGITPAEIAVVSVVANPCMQQLFLGILPSNLARVPFTPVLTHSGIQPAADILPLWKHAELLIVPDISGYVGADTLGCVLSTGMYAREKITLLVDIGTNGEMVLGNKRRMVSCSAAAGPALEGAKIRYGMRGAPGAIDHVWLEDRSIRYSVISGSKAVGICGSGLVDAVAALMELGELNSRGRLMTASELEGNRAFRLTDSVWLTQNDIREFQMAKGAIAAGIELMARHLNIEYSQIEEVLLAGAFGSFINPISACRTGLLPPELAGRIRAVGNAAGSGARMLACSVDELKRTDELIRRIEFLELASQPDFQKIFARNMRL